MSKNITRILCMILTLAMVAAFALVPMASAAAATKTIYFDNSGKKWSTINVYTWNANGTCTGEWPGSAMTKVSGNVYSYEVPADAVNIIFNNGSGSQTSDLTVPTDAKNLYNGSTWGIYGGQPIEVTYILAGSEALCGTAWDPSNTANQLKDSDGDGVYTITYNNVPAYTYEFKVTDGSWDNSWGKDGGDSNYILMLNADSNVTINFDSATGLISVDAVPVAGEHVHSYEQSVIAPSCTQSGYTIFFCVGCGDSYKGNYTNALGHKYVNGTCTTCGEVDSGYVPVAQDYYLFGYINGADYGCGDDLANLGAYKFVNNKVTVTFTEDSYVAVKTSDNASFYMTNGWVGEASSATLYKFTDSTAVSANKLLISGGQTVTFKLVDNLNGTLTISYTVDASTCNHPSHSLDGICTTCGSAVEHSFSNGVCTGCGLSDGSYNPFDHYLFGYINGADYASGNVLGEYKFVNGKLTVSFTQDSYVALKEVYPYGKYGPEVIGYYMTEAYTEETTATFYNSNTGASEKMFVPGGVEVTFTLTTGDGFLTVSYTTGCAHSFSEKVTTAAGCLSAGVKTLTCSKCGYSTTESIPATGHNYVSGKCTGCGIADPSVSGAAYCLVGYINGANYGCEEDHANIGQYVFTGSRLTTSFETDSYIFVKSTDNTKWYLTGSYTTDTSATFYQGGSEKMFVPGGKTLTFTLIENEDGSLTISYVEGAGAASVKPTLTLKAPALEFKDMITVNAFYTAENTQDVVEMGMITYTSKVSVVDIKTAAHVIPGATYDSASGRYFSASQGIHAKYLGDTVYLACYAKLTDGTYAYTKLASYSAVTYATNQLKNSTDAKLKQLVAAMLNYGAAAQNYFGYNTGALANASLTAAQKALPAAYSSSMVQSVPAAPAAKQGTFANNKGFSVRKPAVSFEGAFSINYFFTPAYTPVNGVTLYYWTEADYNAASVLTTANATGAIAMKNEGGQYRGDIEGVAAKDLATAIYVAAVYSDGSTTWTSGVLGYSIGAYCGSQASGTGTMAELAKATAVYGYHAKAYFG